MSSIDTDINIYVPKFGKIKRKRERERPPFSFYLVQWRDWRVLVGLTGVLASEGTGLIAISEVVSI